MLPKTFAILRRLAERRVLLPFALGLAVLVLCGHAVAQMPIIDPTAGGITSTDTSGNTNCSPRPCGVTQGFDFTVSNNLTIVALGMFDVTTPIKQSPPGEPPCSCGVLANSHDVGLWDSAGNLLAKTTIDNTAMLVASRSSFGHWLAKNITPITLPPGTYVLGVYVLPFDADWVFYQTMGPGIPGVTYGTTRDANDAFSLKFPTILTPSDNELFGPMAFTASLVGQNLTLAPFSGNQQTGNIGTQLMNPLVVKATNPDGTSASGVLISFAITGQPTGAAGASLSVMSATTGADGASSTALTLGDRVGQYQVTASCTGSQMCTPVSVTFTENAQALVTTLIDPVPSLVQDGVVISDTGLLSTLLPQAAVVNGVAADGATQVVIHISGAQPNDNLSLNIDADGGLANIGSTSFQPSVSVQADSSGNALALYRAPSDFVRANNTNDLTAQFRTVNLTVQSNSNPATMSSTPISILRPPLVLVHGLWDGPDDWQNFNPVVNDAFGRFQVLFVDYNHSVHITSSTPFYSQSTLQKARTNALGFEFNGSDVLQQIQSLISDTFKSGTNPLGIPVAAVQADIVAHSMGGDIVRFLPLKSGYLGDDNFGAGPVHKLITIGTPHQGTPLASQLLDPANACVRNLFASQNLLTFSSVTVANQSFDGAVFDLEPISSAIASLGTSFAPLIRTALIGGDMTSSQLNGIGCAFCAAAIIRQVCGGGRHPDPLAANFTVQGFPGLIGGASDAIVPLPSALAGFSAGSTFTQVFGAVHSQGAVSLDFKPPTLLDGVLSTPSSDLPNHVITLLNLGATSNAFVSLP